jgi:hypothetical protein
MRKARLVPAWCRHEKPTSLKASHFLSVTTLLSFASYRGNVIPRNGLVWFVGDHRSGVPRS